jgi:exonuclease III
MSKLISWNIAGRIKARSAQLDWIEQEEADVLALQEVIGAFDLRERLLKLGFKFFHPAKPTEGRSKLVAVASRQPFAVISAFTVTHPERAISCRIPLSNKKVELHCVHVPDGSNYGGPRSTKAVFGACLLWVISGHFAMRERCPLYPRKRTFVGVVGMSHIIAAKGAA